MQEVRRKWRVENFQTPPKVAIPVFLDSAESGSLPFTFKSGWCIIRPMKRKIYQKMLEWKASANGASALMLDGVRRVGKSYIAEELPGLARRY